MRPKSSGIRPVTDGEGLAKTRERFLTAEPVEPGRVRDPILASWWRSRQSNVAADRIDMQYLRNPNLDTELSRSAGPVLRQLHEQLSGQPISIVLTDQAGLVLTRLTGDLELARHLDSVQLAPGFSYAEQFVGTNGIGTALEGGGPMHVFGHEHYAENLENLACAGVPIQHPITGKTVGAVDLTCWRSDAGPLLMTLAKSTAVQIRQALLADSAVGQIELLQEYLRVCRRAPGIVVAVNDDVVMMNDYARTVLAPADQDALLRQASEVLAGRRRSDVVDLPTGVKLRLYAKPVGTATPAAGVIHAKVAESSTARTADGGTTARMLLPGIVGSGALWRRACDEVENAFIAGEWLAVGGEPGVGKLAILRAVHQRRNPGGRFTVLDAGEAGDDHWPTATRRALAGENGGEARTVVVRHVDRLDGVALRALASALQMITTTDGTGALWVAVTLSADAQQKELAPLLRLFPSTVDVPPLRHHADDAGQLAAFFVARLGYGGHLTCSPEVLQVMMRSAWPGNVEQLYQTLRQVVQHRRTGMIQLHDLPPETGTLSRRLLSPLESIERDAITQGLMDARGNKAKAAKALGMSRATIYRKIHEYGIVTTP